MRQQQIQDPQIHRSINQTTVIRSDAPQEEIERDMICGVMQMNRGTKTSFSLAYDYFTIDDVVKQMK